MAIWSLSFTVVAAGALESLLLALELFPFFDLCNTVNMSNVT